MADKTEDGGPWAGCAVLFLQSLCPSVNLLSLYKDHQKGKFMVFKIIKLTLIGKRSVQPAVVPCSRDQDFIILSALWPDSARGLNGYEILKVHDADPFLGVEVKFMDVAACQQFLNSYSSGALHQSLSQHACRLLALPQELRVDTQLKAGTHMLDLCLDDLEGCLKHIHLSQVSCCFQELGQYSENHNDAILPKLSVCFDNFFIFHQPERLVDEEIDHLEQMLRSQALRPAEQHPNTNQQVESPVPNNCFKFQNRVFGESE